MENRSKKESDDQKTLGQLLEEKSVELPNPDSELLSGDKVGRNDIADQVDHAGNEVENGPDVDPDDPNLSATMAEAGAEDRRQELGMQDEDEMRLGDPEEESS